MQRLYAGGGYRIVLAGASPEVADVVSKALRRRFVVVVIPEYDRALRTIARELVDTVKQNVTIDWTVKESVRAKLRVIVKRILRKYGYPPDKQEAATNTVLQQAELLSDFWTQAGAV